MKTNDEIITIPYQYDRIRYYKTECPNFYKIMEETKEFEDFNVEPCETPQQPVGAASAILRVG